MEYRKTIGFLDDEDVAMLKKKKTFLTIILSAIAAMSLVVMSVAFTVLLSGLGLLISLIVIAVFLILDAVVLTIIYRFLLRPFVLDLSSGEKICHEGIITNLSTDRMSVKPGHAGRIEFKPANTVSFGEQKVMLESVFFDQLRVGSKCTIHIAPNSTTTLKCLSR